MHLAKRECFRRFPREATEDTMTPGYWEQYSGKWWESSCSRERGAGEGSGFLAGHGGKWA